MKITIGYKVFETVNINGEEYIKLKDVNKLIASRYRERVSKGMENAFENFWKFITELEQETVDVEKEVQKYKW